MQSELCITLTYLSCKIKMMRLLRHWMEIRNKKIMIVTGTLSCVNTDYNSINSKGG